MVTFNENFVKKVYLNEIKVSDRRARLHRRWKDRVDEYMYDRGESTVSGVNLSAVAEFSYPKALFHALQLTSTR